jgi:hypothetical protein
MIHLLFSALVVWVFVWLGGLLVIELLRAVAKPFADRDRAREAERYAEREREYQEYMRAYEERERINRALARIALECHQEK